MNIAMRIANRSALRRSRRKSPIFLQPMRGRNGEAFQETAIEDSIKEKLTAAFKPIHLDVINESYMHSVPKGSETHFKVVVVSQKFENLSAVKRHRLVNATLKEEIDAYIHALAITAKTPAQWEESTKTVPRSPACRGGNKL